MLAPKQAHVEFACFLRSPAFLLTSFLEALSWVSKLHGMWKSRSLLLNTHRCLPREGGSGLEFEGCLQLKQKLGQNWLQTAFVDSLRLL